MILVRKWIFSHAIIFLFFYFFVFFSGRTIPFSLSLIIHSTDARCGIKNKHRLKWNVHMKSDDHLLVSWVYFFGCLNTRWRRRRREDEMLLLLWMTFIVLVPYAIVYRNLFSLHWVLPVSLELCCVSITIVPCYCVVKARCVGAYTKYRYCTQNGGKTS